MVQARIGTYSPHCSCSVGGNVAKWQSCRVGGFGARYKSVNAACSVGRTASVIAPPSGRVPLSASATRSVNPPLVSGSRLILPLSASAMEGSRRQDLTHDAEAGHGTTAAARLSVTIAAAVPAASGRNRPRAVCPLRQSDDIRQRQSAAGARAASDSPRGRTGAAAVRTIEGAAPCR